jgi:4'-phosphopantetheinyl transferase
MKRSGLEVWTAQPALLGAEACDAFTRLLDAEERVRAARLRFEADRCAFIVAHALRRMALAHALAVDPAELRFGTGPHGRPVLLDTDAGSPSFSLTRSRGFVACAVHEGGDVGIDTECMRDGPDGSLLEPFVAAAQPLQGQRDFYRQWTALEAFWKARGLGLSAAHPRISLEEIDADGVFRVVYGDSARDAGMVVMHLPAPDGYVLSLACNEPVSVRLVELERLAAAPQAHQEPSLPKSNEGHCDAAATSNIFGS